MKTNFDNKIILPESDGSGFTQFIDKVAKSGKMSRITMCNNSATVKYEGISYFFNFGDKSISFKDLAFIKTVKKSLIENSERLGLTTPKPKYVNFLNVPPVGTIINNAVEIDISGAYWNETLNIGLINRQIYERGLEVEKLVRLVAIGSAATIKDVFENDGLGGGNVYRGQEYSEAGRAAFFTIAANISKLIHSACWACADGAFFYWVDAIFCREFYSSYICETLASAGHSCTVDKLLSVSFDGVDIHVERENGKKKSYRVKKTMQKKGGKNIINALKSESFAKKSTTWEQS